MIFVYELPDRNDRASGYCFGGGNPITFRNVDFFNEAHEVPMGPNEFTDDQITDEIKRKQYYQSGKSYLVLVGERAFTIPSSTEVAL